MRYNYTLEESDYLTHQLFIASTSKPAIWRRRKSWIITTVSFLIFAWVMERSVNPFLRNYFLGLALLALLFYPLYSRWRYKRHYRKHIKEHYADTFGKLGWMEIQDDHIILQDEHDSESKIHISQVESISELPAHLMVRFKNATTLILPLLKIEQVDQLKLDIKALAQKLGLELKDFTNWKWK